MQIGFIGIGLMGFPMAKNLLKSGYKLKVFNRSQDKAERLKEFGAELSTSIKDAVATAPTRASGADQTYMSLTWINAN